MPEEKTALPVTSSAEPELCAGQRLYKDVLRILEANCVPHAVSGAFALRKHTGVGRPVKDLDIFLTSETAGATLDFALVSICLSGAKPLRASASVDSISEPADVQATES